MKVNIQLLRSDLGPIEIDVEKIIDDQIAAQDFGMFGAIVRPTVHAAVKGAFDALNAKLATAT